jgi:hypothetical protein
LYLQLASDEKVERLPELMNGIEAQFAIFKKMVELEDICGAAKIQSKDLKSSKFNTLATQIIIKAKSLDKNKKVRCGDEDLEMLLKYCDF